MEFGMRNAECGKLQQKKMRRLEDGGQQTEGGRQKTEFSPAAGQKNGRSNRKINFVDP